MRLTLFILSALAAVVLLLASPDAQARFKGGAGAFIANALALENGSGFIALENNSGFIGRESQ